MNAGPSALPIDAGLVARFRAAGAQIAWRELPRGRAGRGRARIARLHEEEARVEERTRSGGTTFVVESGPVGALVVLLEADRRGSLPALRSLAGGTRPGFPNGAIEASWPGGASTVGLGDLVEVARYALV